jgi:hypothetical protein
MSTAGASEDNIESPSTYGKAGYQEYRKKEKKKNNSNAQKVGLNSGIRYSKYAVGGESKEVPASAGLDENDNLNHRKEREKPKQRNSRKNN